VVLTMKHPTFNRKNGTSAYSLHYKTDKKGKKRLDLKREWAIGEDRVLRFINWIKGE